MNILNNLWLAVSTPNEILVKVCISFLLLFIEVPLTFSLISNIFNVKCSKSRKIIYILITSFIAILALNVIPMPFNVIINYLAAFLVIHFIFEFSLLKTVVASILPSIVFMLLENLLLNPFLAFCNISYSDFQIIPIYRFTLASIIYLIVFLIVLALKYKNVSLYFLDDLGKTNKYMILMTFILGLFYIIVQVLLTANYMDILPIQYTFFNFICLLLYTFLSFFTLTKVTKLVATTQKLESAEEYNKTLHILHDSVRGFKHDFDNIVTTIGGYVKTNDMEGLKNYYSQLEEDCSKVNNLYVLNPDIINNPGVYNLLASKYSEAEEKDIKINLTFLLDLNNLHMKIYEFTRILGILLDNAIEAASECDEKEINIVFRNESKNNRNIILIENTYKDKDVNIEQIFNKGVTGKENHTGLGLWEIMQILKKNNNVNLHTDKGKKYFSQQLEIYY